MKKYSSFLRSLYFMMAALLITGCVHDDIYDDPNLAGYECKDLTANMTIAQVKALKQSGVAYVFPDASASEMIMEGYVSSTDETGNIYKTIYIQDNPQNPTHGFTISVDAVSTYTKFPQGSKIYIKLNGLALGTYGGLIQLGVKDAAASGADAVSRIPESTVPAHIFRSCTERAKIVPKILTLAQMSAANDNLLGALIQVNNAEFDRTVLCSNFAPDGTSVDRRINDGTTTATRVVRNSGFASFANQILPSGNGTFVGIMSKFNSTYQMYINNVADLQMNKFPRLDGITADPCALDLTGLTPKTVQEVKQMFSGSLTEITGNYVLKGKVTANDETGNLFKYIYIEDATGGIRVNINKTNLYQDARFKVGKEIYIKLNGLYIRNVNGELQLGSNDPSSAISYRVKEEDVYKTFFDSKKPLAASVPTERTISQLTMADVGRWIKLKDVEYIDSDLGKNYASGQATNRTLKDCVGNTILLRTSHFASFAAEEIDGGRGDVYAILSVFNGTYQLWIPKQIHADLDNPRCDGSIPPTKIFAEDFQNGLTANWTKVSVAGTQEWTTSNQGAGSNYYAVMNGGAFANEDWLVSSEISLSGFGNYSLSFDSDGMGAAGLPLQVFITDAYTGNPTTTNWTQLTAPIDTNLGAWGFINSGLVNLNAYANKNVRIAFKYTSSATASTTWELDNVKVLGQ
ncbi:choice-of-anchor J domain-containing protein [Chryseobacterium sp. cx-311]|uniref:DUF5689 domain-containing protein n=1 Tax=Marnyiella aurantia TaxID=2758037 RepID=UPI001AEA92D0|nr:DUF5689 domain-containing protein [Marnyiella aurantia]MBP0611979.1 choice-of-anchor J domain-containing protein [Marnyiella aurantia]